MFLAQDTHKRRKLKRCSVMTWHCQSHWDFLHTETFTRSVQIAGISPSSTTTKKKVGTRSGSFSRWRFFVLSCNGSRFVDCQDAAKQTSSQPATEPRPACWAAMRRVISLICFRPQHLQADWCSRVSLPVASSWDTLAESHIRIHGTASDSN